jgi:PPE-repeat protein
MVARQMPPPLVYVVKNERVAMDFGTRPPEINSGQIYAGPGSGSMMAVAATWDRLAATLYDVAVQYRSVTAKLPHGSQVTSYLAWLTATAARAQQLATVAHTAATAYESALAAVVPPPMVEENRAARLALAATNFLGQAGPAIAAAEADYEQMWAHDADVMYAYAGASAEACAVTPFASPSAWQAAVPAKAPWVLTAAPQLISAGGQVIAAIPEALQALSSSPIASFDEALSPVTGELSKLSSLSAPLDFAVGNLNSLNKAAALRSLLPAAAGASGSAGLGRATSIGILSVPHAWAASTPLPAVVDWRRVRLVHSGVT